eukprot:scaffold44056_cov204-Skeletonema_marinoi.AAC.2
MDPMRRPPALTAATRIAMAMGILNDWVYFIEVYWTKYEERSTSSYFYRWIGSVDMAERFKNLRGGVYLVKNQNDCKLFDLARIRQPARSACYGIIVAMASSGQAE